MKKSALTIDKLMKAATEFAPLQSGHSEPSLYGVTDGKAVGTYLEGRFIGYLLERFEFETGNAALGIDLPSVNVDIKTTSFKKPQSSCPFRTARQKLYGLGYDLLVFVYEKQDQAQPPSAKLSMRRVMLIESARTGDFQLTTSVLRMLQQNGSVEDLVALFTDRNLPVDEIGATQLAEEVLRSPPPQGYLTISNALQWRLDYTRAVRQSGEVDGIRRVF